jgi:hypothetical protein
MAIGTKADMNVRNPFLHTALTERLTQFSDAFNSASGGAITLGSQSTIGEARHETFFKNISSLVTRRDTTSTSDATAQKLVNGEIVHVKLDRKIGPVDNTIDSFRKIGMGTDEMQIVVGEQAAVAMGLDMLNEGLGAVRAALVTAQSGAAMHAPTTTATTAALVSALYKAGDRADRIVCWVMHSFVYSQLVQQQIAANIDGVSNFNVATATPVTLNRPVIVTDSSALIAVDGVASGNDHYFSLGLTAGALELVNTEEENVLLDIVTGKENLIARVQGEFAYNMGVKGFAYDLTNGGVNPNTAALRTGTNWDIVVSSLKDGPGVVLRTQQTA